MWGPKLLQIGGAKNPLRRTSEGDIGFHFPFFSHYPKYVDKPVVFGPNYIDSDFSFLMTVFHGHERQDTVS